MPFRLLLGLFFSTEEFHIASYSLPHSNHSASMFPSPMQYRLQDVSASNTVRFSQNTSQDQSLGVGKTFYSVNYGMVCTYYVMVGWGWAWHFVLWSNSQ